MWGYSQLQRRGKALPIDEFTAEDSRTTFDDWIPILERAANWNNWTPEESLMQLAGHLRGRALQEWKLLDLKDKVTYEKAVKALKERLDPGNQSLAALDFRHASQKSSEAVSDFIQRLEKLFQTAFGRENLSTETRDMLLYGQLQEGLSYTLMESPSVSGVQGYKELCVAAKKEEKRLAQLRKKQQYLKSDRLPTSSYKGSSQGSPSGSYDKPGGNWNKSKSYSKQRCYLCNSPNHLARDCQPRKSESQGKRANSQKDNKMIRTRSQLDGERESRCAVVKVEGVPVTGLIDTGSDITIIRGDMLYHIISTAGLESSMIRPAKQTACTYDQKPITLDGEMEVNISFGEKMFCTTVYIKFVAPDKLLLSEAVCHRLGIVTYHPEVQAVQRCLADTASSSDCIERNTLLPGRAKQETESKIYSGPVDSEVVEQQTVSEDLTLEDRYYSVY